MSELVPAEDIENIVGARRHPAHHIGRAVSAEQMVYVLHSQDCKDSGIDLRECEYSLALEKGLSNLWQGSLDRPVVLLIGSSGRLIPST